MARGKKSKPQMAQMSADGDALGRGQTRTDTDRHEPARTEAEGAAEISRGRLVEIALGEIAPHPRNPRGIGGLTRELQARVLAELAASIRAEGVLQPVLVRERSRGGIAGEGACATRYELICGERRWRAAGLAGLERIPAIVREMTDEQALEALVTENLQREELTPLEEARGVAMLVDAGWTHEAVADKLGKSAWWVARRASVAKLSRSWVAAIEGGEHPAAGWPATRLELIARLPVETQEALYHRPKGSYGGALEWDEDTTEAELRAAIANITRDLVDAPWGLDVEGLGNRGACVACSERSDAHPELFDAGEFVKRPDDDYDDINDYDGDYDDDEGGQDEDTEEESAQERASGGGNKMRRGCAVCLNAGCWEAKFEGVLAATIERERGEHGAVVLTGWGSDVGRMICGQKVVEARYNKDRKRGRDSVRVVNVADGSVYWGSSWTGVSALAKPGEGEALDELGKAERDLAAAEELLERKRAAAVVDEMRKWIEPEGTIADSKADSFVELAVLAAVFGVKAAPTWDGGKMVEPWDIYRELMDNTDSPEVILERAVKPSLLDKLRYNNQEEAAKRALPFAERLAQALGRAAEMQLGNIEREMEKAIQPSAKLVALRERVEGLRAAKAGEEDAERLTRAHRRAAEEAQTDTDGHGQARTGTDGGKKAGKSKSKSKRKAKGAVVEPEVRICWCNCQDLARCEEHEHDGPVVWVERAKAGRRFWLCRECSEMDDESEFV